MLRAASRTSSCNVGAGGHSEDCKHDARSRRRRRRSSRRSARRARLAEDGLVVFGARCRFAGRRRGVRRVVPRRRWSRRSCCAASPLAERRVGDWNASSALPRALAWAGTTKPTSGICRLPSGRGSWCTTMTSSSNSTPARTAAPVRRASSSAHFERAAAELEAVEVDAAEPEHRGPEHVAQTTRPPVRPCRGRRGSAGSRAPSSSAARAGRRDR